MSKLVFNRDGGKTDEFGHLIGLMRFMQGEVIEGLQVAANGSPNMTVNVPYGIAAIPVGSGATGYRYFVGLDATENIAIPTANGSNPRNDLIVMYVDKAVTPSQSFTNNSNNMLKIMVVSGAPASTPADPSGAAIQAAVGAANPYIVLARVLTGTGVTQINSGNITDLRSLTTVSRLLTNMVITAHIQDQAVTTAKIADLGVTNAKLGTGSVTGAKILNYKYYSQENTTNTTQNTVVLQGGWGQFLGNNTAGITKAVTFPVAVTKVLSIRINLIGYKSSAGAAANIGDFNTSISQTFNVAPYAVTTTGFTAFFSGASNFGPAYHGFSWEIVAIQ